MTTIIDRPAQERREKMLRSSFPYFVKALWADRRLDRVHPLGDIDMDFCEYVSGGPSPREVLAFRGFGKTTILCALFMYRGLRDPNREQIMFSKSLSHAKKAVGLCREWVDTVWFLRHLAPTPDVSDTTIFFDFGTRARGRSKQPSVSAYGIDGMPEGNRAHGIAGDDIETKGNTRTQEGRELLVRLCGEFTNILYPDLPRDKGGPVDPCEIIMAGTLKHEESLYKDRAKKGYTVRTYPLAVPSLTDQIMGLAPIITTKIAAGELKHTTQEQYQNNPIFPGRFPAEEILKRMAEGRHEFAMEHMLISDLSDAQRYPLRLSDLMVMSVPRDVAPITVTYGTRDHSGETTVPGIPSLGLTGDKMYRPFAIDSSVAPYQGTKAVIDIAGEGSDKTGVAIVSMLNGTYWVKYCRGHDGGTSTASLAEIAELCRQHGVREVFVETNIDIFDTYTPMLEVELRKLFLEPNPDASEYPQGWKCSIERFRVGGQKEERICGVLGPVFAGHRIVMDPASLLPRGGEKDHETLQYQITRIQRIRKCLREDGAIDALASCIAKWQEQSAGVRIDPARNRQRVEDNAVLELKRRMAGAGATRPGWLG